MNHKRFDQIVEERLARCREVLCAKGEEYSRNNDRLWNFKAAARHLDTTTGKALLGMKVKHDVSLSDMIDDIDSGCIFSRGYVSEKIGDSINYLLLLEGLIEEARDDEESSSCSRVEAAVARYQTREGLSIDYDAALSGAHGDGERILADNSTQILNANQPVSKSLTLDEVGK